MATLPRQDPPFLVETRSAEETRRLAVAISPVLVPGDMVVLAGDLGTGKTTFVQGIAVGLGITEQVTSPTFILMKEYHGGRYPLMHMDIYRMQKVQELIDLGYDEFLDPSHIVIVEWGDMVEPLLPKDHLQVEISYGRDDDQRLVALRPKGHIWSARLHTIKVLAAELFSADREGQAFGRSFDPGKPKDHN